MEIDESGNTPLTRIDMNQMMNISDSGQECHQTGCEITNNLLDLSIEELEVMEKTGNPYYYNQYFSDKGYDLLDEIDKEEKSCLKRVHKYPQMGLQRRNIWGYKCYP